MVESLKELGRICQKPRYREVGNWMVRHIVRDAALPITWLLLHTSITANQVTFFSLLIGVGGIWLLAFPSKAFFLMGAILLQLWYLLDHVDGQIARYRKTACLTGRFFDFLAHHLIHGVVFFSLGFYSFQAKKEPLWIVWGFLTSLAMMFFNLINDTKYKTFFERLDHLSSEGAVVLRKTDKSSFPQKDWAVLRKTFSLFHKVSEIHVVMNTLTLAALVEIFLFPSLDFRGYLFIGYGILVPLVAILKISYWIAKRKIDQEFKALFLEEKAAS